MDLDKIREMFKGRDKGLPPVDSGSKPDSIASAAEDAQAKKVISLSKELDIAILDLSNYKINTELIRLIPEDVSRNYRIIPVSRFGDILTLAISDPFDIVTLDSVKAISKMEIQLVLGFPAQITRAIESSYGQLQLERAIAPDEVYGTGKEKKLKALPQRDERIDVKEIQELSQSAQIIEIVNGILAEALGRRASDIHIEPYPDALRIRYRIDGVLHEKSTAMNKKNEPAIVARIKIMSELDITQRRLPQDGRISIKIENRSVDLRVSILPLSTGEKVVLRILEKGGLQLDLERLGFSEYAFKAFKEASQRPHGIILLTGPTGSGKSTTLYALLNRLNNMEKNLITIEDPVEYQMKGITQIQVRSEIGLNFASILRAVLRQNPDVVMVGEIRDFETVDIAIKAGLTGHLILSTLHTNDAPSAIVRLVNMGTEPFLIASTLALIAAQRLCRKVCPKCKEAHEVPVANISGLSPDFKAEKATFYRGKGCSYCNNTGYFGRIAIVEALLIEDDIRQMILKRASLAQIREYARVKGMRTLREDAMEKCLKGDISLEEVLRVTPEE